MRETLIGILVCFCLYPLWGQVGIPYVYNFNKLDYDASGQNWTCASDGEGRIYIGNSIGLLQYNGIEWRQFTLPKGNYVRAVHLAENGRIYVGSFEEFGYFLRDEFGRMLYTSLSDSVRGYTFHNDQIWDILTADGCIYFRSMSSYFVYDGQQVHVVEIPYILTYMQEVDGILYAFCQGKGLGVMEKSTFRLVLPLSEIGGSSEVVSLLPYGDSAKILVTNKGGLYLWKEEKCSVWNRKVNSIMEGQNINKALMTKDSVCILGTQNNGVYAFNMQGELQWHVNTDRGLHNNTVLGLHCDEGNNIWVALDDGISYIRHDSATRMFKPMYPNVGGVLSACFHDGYLYLATNQGLFYSPHDGDSFQAVPFPDMSLQAWELAVFDDQLLCGHNAGTYRIEGKKLIKLSDIDGGTNMKRATIHEQEVIVQSSYTYLSIYKKDKQGMWSFSHTIPNFLQPIRNIEIDSRGCIWASHFYKGVFCVQLSSDLRQAEQVTYFPEIGENGTQDVVDVFSLRGRIVFYNGNKYYTHDDLHNAIVPFEQLNETEHRLLGIRKAVAMDNTTYWCVCEEAFAKIYMDDDTLFKETVLPFRLFQYDIPDYNENICKTDNGRCIVCLNNGIAVIDTDVSIYAHESRRGIRMEQVQAINAEGKKVYLPLDNKGKIQVPYSYNSMTFSVSPACFVGNNVSFTFELKGLEEGMMAMEQGATMTYTRLPWGEYTLHVTGYDVMSNQFGEIEYTFEIHAPFYATNEAILLYIVLFSVVGLLLYVLIRRYITQSKKRFAQEQEKLRKIEHERQESEIIRLRNENLENELTFKGKELANTALMLSKKNEILSTIKTELMEQKEHLGVHYPNKYYTKVIKLIDESMSSEDEWRVFQENFDLIHESFFRNLLQTYPELTPNDLKMCSLLRLNLTTKDIANFLGISPRGVEIARYRLRKKMQLTAEQNLVNFLIEFK